MDNDFMDDEGAQQARRRRFQTGLFMILILFLMDPKQKTLKQESAKNQKILSNTVSELTKRLKALDSSSGDNVALMNSSYAKGKWQLIDKKDARTIVPEMEGGSKSMVEPSEEVKEGSTHGKIRRKDLSSYPDVSIVVGELQFEDSFFHKSSKDYAVFEGLFFHKFGHMSAVVGLNKEPLKAVWYKHDDDLPHAVMGPNDATENRLDSGTADATAAVNLTAGKGGVDNVGGVVDSIDEEASEGDDTMDEGEAKRERALSVLQGRGLEEHWQTRLSPEEEGSKEARSEARKWVSWGASEERLAGDAGGGLRGWRREKYARRWDGEVFGQEQGARREVAHLAQGRHWIAADVGETQRRYLSIDAGSPSPISAAEKAQDQVVEDVGAAEAEMAVVEVGAGAEGLGEFPVMVLPQNAVVGPERGSGLLPFGYDLRSAPKSKCMFLLTLQTPDKGNGNVSRNVDDGDEEKEGQNAFVKTMRGEMVGVNCDFSADIEVKLSEFSGGAEGMSFTAMILMLCLLQTCVICCRIGCLLARRRYGRNFLVPRRFQPPKFDYHRPIPPELIDQANRETAGGQDSEEGRDLERGNLLECVICYAPVDGALQDYMLTPCDHVFHQSCLTRWMSVKMECPTCRRELPPPLE